MMRDLNCLEPAVNFSMGTICQRESSSPHHVDLRGGLIGKKIAYGNVFATNSLGFFGPVHQTSWDDADAKVACRQLGFSFGEAVSGSEWGPVPENVSIDGCCHLHRSRIQLAGLQLHNPFKWNLP